MPTRTSMNKRSWIVPSCRPRRSRRSGALAPAWQHQSGVGLLEILIAVILLSIGFLAAARMQVEGMRYSHDAYTLSQARFMVMDMTERMRVNRDALQGNAYRGKSTRAGTANPSCVINETPCSPADIATADLHAWSLNLHAPDGDSDFIPILPSSENIPAIGSITFDAAEGAYVVSVQWSENIKGIDSARSLAVRVFP